MSEANSFSPSSSCGVYEPFFFVPPFLLSKSTFTSSDVVLVFTLFLVFFATPFIFLYFSFAMASTSDASTPPRSGGLPYAPFPLTGYSRD